MFLQNFWLLIYPSGYHYYAQENGPILTSYLEQLLRKGDNSSVKKIFEQHPFPAGFFYKKAEVDVARFFTDRDMLNTILGYDVAIVFPFSTPAQGMK